jgi:hypothetical protein
MKIGRENMCDRFARTAALSLPRGVASVELLVARMTSHVCSPQLKIAPYHTAPGKALCITANFGQPLSQLGHPRRIRSGQPDGLCPQCLETDHESEAMLSVAKCHKGTYSWFVGSITDTELPAGMGRGQSRAMFEI